MATTKPRPKSAPKPSTTAAEALWKSDPFWPDHDIQDGEPCFAIMLFEPPLKTRWRPKGPRSIPPLSRGKRVVWWQHRETRQILWTVDDFNTRQMAQTKPGRAPASWAIAVRMIYGQDETARPVIGGEA